jgi:hypothetical protein
MPAASFVKDAVTLTFGRGPRRPDQSAAHLQSAVNSTGGDRRAGAIYATDSRLALSFIGMSAADLAALESFFLTTVDGMAQTFTYNDTAGAAHTVRFAEPRLDITDKAQGRYDVNLTLRIS